MKAEAGTALLETMSDVEAAQKAANKYLQHHTYGQAPLLGFVSNERQLPHQISEKHTVYSLAGALMTREECALVGTTDQQAELVIAPFERSDPDDDKQEVTPPEPASEISIRRLGNVAIEVPPLPNPDPEPIAA